MPFSPCTRRHALQVAGTLALGVTLGWRRGTAAPRTEFDVRNFGAVGDGVTSDTAAIQRAIDAAAAQRGARVIIPGGHRCVIGTIELKGAIDFHLADDAELIVSANPGDFSAARAALVAKDVQGLTLSGTGTINGRSEEFMAGYDAVNEWWLPKPFRPRLALLAGCRDLTVRDVTFQRAPSWTLHLLGCDRVLVDGIKIQNQMDVPNCDGIDPDHCRHVEITRCQITCGDDAVVVKASREGAAYGGSSDIAVRDCVLETQDSGVKIGTETTRDIERVTFERCEIKSSCRGCTIQLRDEGHVRDIVFRDLTFKARYHSDPWWGRGEAISFTALPRQPGAPVGKISNVRVENVTGTAENSVRISGSAESRISDVTFDRVDVTLSRWTKYPGGLWDNRPTTAYAGIESHPTVGIHVRHADRVKLQRCRVRWGSGRSDYFSHALAAHDVTGLEYPDFVGEAAHPERDAAIDVRA